MGRPTKTHPFLRSWRVGTFVRSVPHKYDLVWLRSLFFRLPFPFHDCLVLFPFQVGKAWLVLLDGMAFMSLCLPWTVGGTRVDEWIYVVTYLIRWYPWDQWEIDLLVVDGVGSISYEGGWDGWVVNLPFLRFRLGMARIGSILLSHSQPTKPRIEFEGLDPIPPILFSCSVSNHHHPTSSIYPFSWCPVFSSKGGRNIHSWWGKCSNVMETVDPILSPTTPTHPIESTTPTNHHPRGATKTNVASNAVVQHTS